MNLSDLGYNYNPLVNNKGHENGFDIARVITVQRESYIINNGEREYFAKLTGNLIYSSDSPEDFPTVGDFVQFQNFEDDTLAIIHKVLDRKTLLKRKSAGKKIEYQLIAANIDYAIVMQGLDNDFNINRLERYLAMAKEFGIEPIIMLNKTDLISFEKKGQVMNDIESRLPNVRTVLFSNFEEKNLKDLRIILQPGKTYCLIGSSGVGKTTLINNLVGKDVFQTKEVREDDSKGRHTTTIRHLVILENGSMIIDTPGMRELANISVSGGIDQTFDEISELSMKCKFNDCTHTNEEGCAVLLALESGKLDEEKYKNYVKLKKESEHYERSYLEKRRRDKEFGKMVKSILKNKKK
jgi:ribosome biogenesis GTPase